MSKRLLTLVQEVAALHPNGKVAPICAEAHMWLSSLPEEYSPEDAWERADIDWQDWFLGRLRFRAAVPASIARVVRLAPSLVDRLPSSLRRTLPATLAEEHAMAFFATLRGESSPFPMHPADTYTIERLDLDLERWRA